MASSLFGMQTTQIPQTVNPVLKAVASMRGGADPRQMLRQMAGGNPQLAQIVQMIDGGTSMQAIAQQLCQQRGTTPEAVAKQLGLF